MDKKLQAVRKRLLTDFPFYSRSALKIRTKDGDIAPLKLNPAQQILQDAIDKQMADGQDQDYYSEGSAAGLSTMVVVICTSPLAKAKEESICFNTVRIAPV